MLKAASWRSFLEAASTGAVEPERMVDLPMVKSAVRGMDTITNFTSSLPSGAVTRFAVWGYSKLGSATLMTGAVDPRVEAIAPVAFTVADRNFIDAVLLQAAPAPWSPYSFLADWVGTRELNLLRRICNPFNHMERLTMPKLVVMDTNDRWFDDCLPNVSHYWPRMPEPKSLLFMEGDHDSVMAITAPPVIAFVRGVLLDVAAPAIEYSHNERTAVITVHATGHVPRNVTLHSGLTCTRNEEDHRPEFLDARWGTERILNETRPGSGTWHADISYGEDTAIEFAMALGSCAKGSFVSLEYEWPEPGYSFTSTTPVFLYEGLRDSLPPTPSFSSYSSSACLVLLCLLPFTFHSWNL
jgi:hypothetical protein